MNERKPESGFRGRRRGTSGSLASRVWPAVFLLSFGLALAGCISCNDGLSAADVAAAGTDTSGDVTADDSGVTPPAAGYVPGRKEVKVKFEVKNGGYGLLKSGGIVSAQDDSYLVYNNASYANDFTIKIMIPSGDEYVNIRWKGEDWISPETYVKAKMKIHKSDGAYIIVIDYNGFAKVATEYLYDVLAGSYHKTLPDYPVFDYFYFLGQDWEYAKGYAVTE